MSNLKRTLSSAVSILLVAGIGACGGSGDSGTEGTPAVETATSAPSDSTSPDEMAAPSVEILEPAGGSTVDGPDVRVVLGIEGMQIRPAGDTTPHSGHHHLLLDHDLPDPTAPIPSIPGQVIHMGDGSSEYVFEGVQPGEHRIIAVVGDLAHVPLQPWVVDTVVFTVR